MVTLERLILLIDEASSIAGSQAKVAALLGIPKNHITEMKKGRRPCTWRTRGKLRVILGEEPTRAFMAEIAADLEQSSNADELQAAKTMQAMIAAIPPNQEKTPDAQMSSGGSVWRKRRDSNPR